MNSGGGGVNHGRRLRWLWLAGFCFVWLSGCATTREEDRESELPWSQRQPWEGVIPMPGFEYR